MFICLQYEMLFVFISSNLSEFNDIDENKKSLQALMKRAMGALNTTHGTKLYFNYPFLAHKTRDSYQEWLDIDDGVNVHNLNDTVVCISDDEDEDDDAVVVDAAERNNRNDSTELLSTKISVQDLQDDCFICDCCCCTNYNFEFNRYFGVTNIKIAPNESTDKKASHTCPICCKTVNNGQLCEHINSDCAAFCA